MSEPVITMRGLRKSYGATEAVQGVDLDVQRGEIFGLLGPNGAGKTTTVEILEGYRRRDAGDVKVLGLDPARPTRGWRSRVGIVLQSCQVEPELTVRESLELFAGYFPAPRRVDEIIDLVGLADQRSKRAGQLSGGQQRRLDVGLALIGDPELLFLDEPTTGFDPSARRQAWDVIRSLRELGTTVLLTTHYMDEAQALADRVAIIAQGRVIAEGPPGQLGGREAASTWISFRLPEGVSPDELPEVLRGKLEVHGGLARLRTNSAVRDLNALTGWAVHRGTDLPDLEVTRPSLEDIYLELTMGK
jgi:ABC-2 type transport system ATP-binding protein